MQTDHTQVTYHPGPDVCPAKLSPLSIRPGLIPRWAHNPLSEKKRGSASIVKFKATSTVHLVLPRPTPVCLRSPGASRAPFHQSPPTALPLKLGRTLALCRPVKLVPSCKSTAPMPADRWSSLVLKAAGPVWVVKGRLVAAFHMATVPKPSLLYS